MSSIENDNLSLYLSAYLDGELTPEESALVKRILEENPEARALLEDLQVGADLLQNLPRHTAPATLLEDIGIHLEREDLLNDIPASRVETRTPWRRQFAAAAMFVIIVTGGLWGFVKFGPNLVDPKREMLTTTGKIDDSPTVSAGDVSNLPPLTSKTTPKSSSPVTEKSTAVTSLAHVLSFEQKAKIGMSAREVLDHRFENESNKLMLQFENGEDLTATYARLLEQLFDRGGTNLRETPLPTRLDKIEGELFYTGLASVNYPANSDRQLLIRVPASAINEVFTQVKADTGESTNAVLKLGELRANGWEEAERLALQMAGDLDVSEETTMLAQSDPEATESGTQKIIEENSIASLLVGLTGINDDVIAPKDRASLEAARAAGNAKRMDRDRPPVDPKSPIDRRAKDEREYKDRTKGQSGEGANSSTTSGNGRTNDSPASSKDSKSASTADGDSPNPVIKAPDAAEKAPKSNNPSNDDLESAASKDHQPDSAAEQTGEKSESAEKENRDTDHTSLAKRMIAELEAKHASRKNTAQASVENGSATVPQLPKQEDPYITLVIQFVSPPKDEVEPRIPPETSTSKPKTEARKKPNSPTATKEHGATSKADKPKENKLNGELSHSAR